MPQQKIEFTQQQIRSALSIKWDYADYNPVELFNETVEQQLTNVSIIKNMIFAQ